MLHHHTPAVMHAASLHLSNGRLRRVCPEALLLRLSAVGLAAASLLLF